MSASETLIDSDTNENSIFYVFAQACDQHHRKVAIGNTPLFTTDANLYDLYLASFEGSDERQHHTCSCCKNFIERYGHLAVIDDEGVVRSAIWPNLSDVPPMYYEVAKNLSREVARATITGVFVSTDSIWGTPVTGKWTHFAVRPDPARISIARRELLEAPHEVMALKKQHFSTLSRGLAEYNKETVSAAVTLLLSDELHRSEKVLGPAQFLFDLHAKLEGIKGDRRKNLIWKAVATAPVGFATPRSSMVGTLLDDIASGMSLESVRRRFAEKMHPLQYQRPQAPASAGNIAQAEKIVEKLGIAPSLRRRFAKIEEMKLIWSPKPIEEKAASGGIFDHLKTDTTITRPSLIPNTTMTWVKFAATILPKTEKIKILVKGSMPFCGLVTAAVPDAPPIIVWDNENERNPVSWYFYNGGSTPSQWGLRDNSWIDVTGITLKPSMWAGEDKFTVWGKDTIFILKDAKEQQSNSLALFPEILRSELHQIRSTIESFSKRGQVEGADEGTANGLMIGRNPNILIQVTTAMGIANYSIDRWD